MKFRIINNKPDWFYAERFEDGNWQYILNTGSTTLETTKAAMLEACKRYLLFTPSVVEEGEL